MKYLTLFLLTLSSIITYAQPAGAVRVVNIRDEPTPSNVPDSLKVYNVVDNMPIFPGGDSSLHAFIRGNIKYPVSAKKDQVEGKVIVGIIINKDGSISEAHIKKGVSSDLDKEALRVVSLLPKFIAGKQQGKAVRVQYAIPVIFKL